jgi:hypothetical protein
MKISVSLVTDNMFQILEVHYTTAINNNWMFCVAFQCKLWTKVTKLNVNIVDESKLFIEVHPVSASLKTH